MHKPQRRAYVKFFVGPTLFCWVNLIKITLALRKCFLSGQHNTYDLRTIYQPTVLNGYTITNSHDNRMKNGVRNRGLRNHVLHKRTICRESRWSVSEMQNIWHTKCDRFYVDCSTTLSC
jgi:hypothetical protein